MTWVAIYILAARVSVSPRGCYGRQRDLADRHPGPRTPPPEVPLRRGGHGCCTQDRKGIWGSLLRRIERDAVLQPPRPQPLESRAPKGRSQSLPGAVPSPLSGGNNVTTAWVTRSTATALGAGSFRTGPVQNWPVWVHLGNMQPRRLQLYRVNWPTT